MIPAFATQVRSNAKKVKPKGPAHPFYFAMTPDTKRQVFFIGQSPGKPPLLRDLPRLRPT